MKITKEEFNNYVKTLGKYYGLFEYEDDNNINAIISVLKSSILEEDN